MFQLVILRPQHKKLGFASALNPPSYRQLFEVNCLPQTIDSFIILSTNYIVYLILNMIFFRRSYLFQRTILFQPCNRILGKFNKNFVLEWHFVF